MVAAGPVSAIAVLLFVILSIHCLKFHDYFHSTAQTAIIVELTGSHIGMRAYDNLLAYVVNALS